MSGKPSAVYRNRMQRYPDKHWLIWSNKWGCWYRDNCQGYTSDISQAGVYNREEAAQHYCGDVPKKHRDVEPFPLSSVVAMMRLRAEQLIEDARSAERRARQLLARVEQSSCQ